jgi:hypothetical protein
MYLMAWRAPGAKQTAAFNILLAIRLEGRTGSCSVVVHCRVYSNGRCSQQSTATVQHGEHLRV